MLGISEYLDMWKKRIKIYKQNNLEGVLITTDEINGINEEKINRLVDDLIDEKLEGNRSEFSSHHYTLG